MNVKVHEVYGASKFLQKVTEAPASVSIITAAEIEKYGYLTLADVLKGVRGFYINDTRGYTSIGARGFGRPGDYNTRVLLLVDGHRVSDNVYSSAFIGPEFPVHIDLIDRIEIIRGPSSSLYGTNAFFAVINVITKRGYQLNGPELSTEAASYDTLRSRASYGKQFSNGLDLLLSASFSDSRGHERLYFKEYDAPETNNGVALNADGEDVRRLFTSLSYRDFSLQGVYGERKKHIPTGSFETIFNDPGTYAYDSYGYVDLKYERSLSTSAQLAARLYYDHYYYRGNYIYSVEGEEGAQRTINNDWARGLWWGGEVSLTTHLLDKHRLIAGTELRNNFRQDQKNYDEDPYFLNFDDRRSSREWAVYAEDGYRVSRRLLLNAGIRYDHSSAFGGSANPRFGLVYNPFEKTTVKLLYGQAFRGPNVYERLYGFADDAGSRSSLRPETIRTTEMVFEQYLGDHFRVAVSGFSYRIRNLINQVYFPEADEYLFTNIGRVRSEGIEAEVETKLRNGIQGIVSYAYQKAVDPETGSRLNNSPAHLGKLNMNMPLVKERLWAGLELQYESRRLTLAGDSTSPFLLTNLTLLGKRLAKHFDLSLSVYNLFDRKYAHPATVEHLQDQIPQNGRNFRLKLTFSLPQ